MTRKTTLHRWYWKETLPQAVLAAMLPAALVVGLATGRLASPGTLIAAGYWGVVYSAALGGFVARGWFGSRPVRLVRPTAERRRPEPPGQEHTEPEPPGHEHTEAELVASLTAPAPAS